MIMWGRRRRPWRTETYIALDLETTGLRPAIDEIVSVGMVPVRNGIIRWGERLYTVVRSSGRSTIQAEAMGVHQILPGEADVGPDLERVVAEVDRWLADAVLIVHHAAIDVRFLQRAFARFGRPWPRPPTVDTVRLLAKLERRLTQLEPYPAPVPRGLAEARRRMGLPEHRAHHALADALATAELFLAVRARLRAERLGQLL
jgi:DNA polymerase-3 subunit epsilon